MKMCREIAVVVQSKEITEAFKVRERPCSPVLYFGPPELVCVLPWGQLNNVRVCVIRYFYLLHWVRRGVARCGKPTGKLSSLLRFLLHVSWGESWGRSVCGGCCELCTVDNFFDNGHVSSFVRYDFVFAFTHSMNEVCPMSCPGGYTAVLASDEPYIPKRIVTFETVRSLVLDNAYGIDYRDY